LQKYEDAIPADKKVITAPSARSKAAPYALSIRASSSLVVKKATATWAPTASETRTVMVPPLCLPSSLLMPEVKAKPSPH
jgi:hypothetical protein